MTSITEDEVEPGLVAFLDQAELAGNNLVMHTKDLPGFSARTFVCVEVDGDVSEWIPMTTEYRPERLAVRLEWRSGGHPQWLRDHQYVSDGANVWRGPPAAFVEASRAEVTDEANRARVSAEGLDEIRREIERQRHRRDRP